MEGKSNSEFQKSGGKKRLAKKYGFSLFPSKKLIPTKDLIFVKKKSPPAVRFALRNRDLGGQKYQNFPPAASFLPLNNHLS